MVLFQNRNIQTIGLAQDFRGIMPRNRRAALFNHKLRSLADRRQTGLMTQLVHLVLYCTILVAPHVRRDLICCSLHHCRLRSSPRFSRPHCRQDGQLACRRLSESTLVSNHTSSFDAVSNNMPGPLAREASGPLHSEIFAAFCSDTPRWNFLFLSLFWLHQETSSLSGAKPKPTVIRYLVIHRESSRRGFRLGLAR